MSFYSPSCFSYFNLSVCLVSLVFLYLNCCLVAPPLPFSAPSWCAARFLTTPTSSHLKGVWGWSRTGQRTRKPAWSNGSGGATTSAGLAELVAGEMHAGSQYERQAFTGRAYERSTRWGHTHSIPIGLAQNRQLRRRCGGGHGLGSSPRRRTRGAFEKVRSVSRSGSGGRFGNAADVAGMGA